MNRTNFSQVWWAKYFGLYSCHNKTGLVDAMYFGSNDLFINQPELRDGNSCSLNMLEKQLCKHNGRHFHTKEYSFLTLIFMINRAANPRFGTESDVIECHVFARLVIIQFIHSILRIVCPEDNIWVYNPEARKLKRNDDLWRKLFVDSTDTVFDIENIWKLFSNGGKVPTPNAKQANLIGEPVDYDAPIANAYSHGKQCQILQPNGRGKVITLNRFPVVLDGERVDIVDRVYKFFIENLIDHTEKKNLPSRKKQGREKVMETVPYPMLLNCMIMLNLV